MPGLEGYDCEGTLTINSISMNRPAWAVIGDERGEGGLWPLKFLLEKRGEDRLVPSAAGFIAYPKRVTGVRLDLRFLVTGDVNSSGVDTADSRAGLEANLAYVYTNVIAPPTLPTVTRTMTLTMFGGGTITAQVHVVGLQPRNFIAAVEGSAIAECTLQLAIPAGRMT